jgi:predicted lipid-binding transport protein (Tim44 family)
MTPASRNRIEAFVASFIHSEFVSNWTSEKDADFWNEPERAERCAAAAENCADGKTHAEVIEDWREAFVAYIRNRRAWADPERFIAGVNAHFDAVEAWHEKNGSLYQEIG